MAQNFNAAKKLKAIRMYTGYAQYQLAEKTGVSLRVISNLENGCRCAATDNDLWRLASALCINPEVLLHNLPITLK